MRSQDEVAAMSCPVCRVPLAMSDRQGIEIDYCPQCRGVWLDRGELDKIIERSAPPAQAAPPEPPRGAYDPRGDRGWSSHSSSEDYGDRRHSGYSKPYKKRKNWLEEIFD